MTQQMYAHFTYERGGVQNLVVVVGQVGLDTRRREIEEDLLREVVRVRAL